MITDVIAQLGKTAGVAARRSRFSVDGPNMDVIAGMGKAAAEKAAFGSGMSTLLQTAGKAVPAATKAVGNWWTRDRGNALGATANWIGNRIGDVASVPFKHPRWTAGIAGGVCATALGVNAYEHNQSTPGQHLHNPFTWFNPKTTDEAFKYNRENYNRMAAPWQAKLQEAINKGDEPTMKAIQNRLSTGNFTEDTKWSPNEMTLGNNPLTGALGTAWRMGGYNPLVPFTGSYYARGMGNIQKQEQGDLDRIINSNRTQEGDYAKMQQLKGQLTKGNLLPAEAQGIQMEYDKIRSRQGGGGWNSAQAQMKRRGMELAGMRVRPDETPKYDTGTGWGRGQTPPALAPFNYSTGLRDWSHLAQPDLKTGIQGR